MTKNIFHRFLDIPVDPNIDLFNRMEYDINIYSHIKVSKEEINPELFCWLEQFDFTIEWFEAFYTPPNGGKLPIHTDSQEVDDKVKINWTYGAPGSKLIWWEPRSDNYINTVKTAFGTTYLTADEDNCTKLYEVEIVKPSLVNAGLFHSTYNPSSQGRWTLSLPLFKTGTQISLTWNEAMNKLNGIINDTL